MIYGVKADSVLYETTRLSVYPPHGPEIILPLLSSIGIYFFLSFFFILGILFGFVVVVIFWCLFFTVIQKTWLQADSFMKNQSLYIKT